ncbi:hypothetical protein E2C01_012292 [Portunus trituberculatus]|uniref:Uncharacterized protein n=1 Tax=Portunus trituberculatus TaxID=210409 RepID=A0A5B7DDS0_PORTR|nr:hypothetical protein [Portunus trituberculatus]
MWSVSLAFCFDLCMTYVFFLFALMLFRFLILKI